MNKTIKTEIALGILIIIAVIVGGVIWVNGKRNTQVSIQPIVSNNWKTYQNDEYGFKLEYPDDVELHFGYIKDNASIGKFFSPGKIYGVKVWMVGELLPNQTLIDFERDKRDEKKHEGVWPKGFRQEYVEKEILIDGQKKIMWIDIYTGGSTYPGNTAVVPFEHNNKVFEVSTLLSRDETQTPKFFDQILSTFKFTN